jgi:glutamyl-tRNA synthetase
MTDLENTITEAALENAIKFKGKASQGAIIGKLMSVDPTIKQRMKDVAPIIGKILGTINALTLDEQKAQLLALNPDFENEQAAKKQANKEGRNKLPELKNAEMGKVVTRIAPEPSKYNHIGHAVSFLLNYMYAVKYEGKCIMRFDDTNPDKCKQEYVDAMQEDVLDYLGINAEKIVFASDYQDDFITKAESLITDSKAYTTNQEQADMSLYRREMKDHSDRDKDVALVQKEWAQMKEGGDFVLRLKIDMQHKNAVMRDPVIFRVVADPHYKTDDKYKVWPMYDLECAILEGALGVTHVLRGSEFESRIELQDHIRSLFDLQNPTIKQYARTNVQEATTKGREIRELIETGDYIGWDDPRLVTLRALKRRGIVREAFYELAKVVGMSKTNSFLDFSVISSINRKLLDESAKRFFCVIDPVDVVLEDAPARILKLNMHPHKDLGVREFNTTNEYLLEKKDVDEMADGEHIRLIDNLNFVNNQCVSELHRDFAGDKLIQFLVKDETMPITVRMPDNVVLEGFAERDITTLEVGEVIQFQRFGFCRLDAITNGVYEFWYTHD